MSSFFFFLFLLFSFPVNIHYVLGRNTLDDVVWPMLSNKLDSIGRAVSGEALSLSIGQWTNI